MKGGILLRLANIREKHHRRGLVSRDGSAVPDERSISRNMRTYSMAVWRFGGGRGSLRFSAPLNVVVTPSTVLHGIVPPTAVLDEFRAVPSYENHFQDKDRSAFYCVFHLS